MSDFTSNPMFKKGNIGHQMCNIASQTWMMAASAFIRTSDREDLEGPDDVEEVNQVNNQNNQMVLVGDKSSLPLVIPNQQHCPQHLVVSASGCTSGPTSPTTASPEMEKGSYSYCAMSYDTIPMNSQASSMSSSTSGSDEMAISGSGDVDNLTIYSMAEVRKHRDVSDGWMVIYDKVYDVTDFLDEHPGGAYVMEDYLGFDATLAFRSVGHSTDALTMLDNYLIGILPRNERLYVNKLRW